MRVRKQINSFQFEKIYLLKLVPQKTSADSENKQLSFKCINVKKVCITISSDFLLIAV